MLKNIRGSALGMGLMFVGAVGAGAMYFIQKSNNSADTALKDIRIIKARVEAKKISAVIGYLISNNLVLCKEKTWGDGISSNSCRWAGDKAEQEYKPSEFGLKLSTDNKGLEFSIDKPKVGSSFSGGTVKLELIDIKSDESLMDLVGSRPDDVKPFDKDDSVIKSTINLKVELGANQVEQVITTSIFKRPLAVPKVRILASSCASQCQAPMSEHPNPACRGPFTIDSENSTEVNAFIVNQGPGVIYDLAFERQVNYVSEVVGVEAIADKKVEVPINDFIDVDQSVEWVDTVKCATFVKEVTEIVTTNNAYEAGTEVETTVSQHSEPAGSVNYSLSASDGSKSHIEPFRLMSNYAEGGDLGGKEEFTKTTVTIYVEPSH